MKLTVRQIARTAGVSPASVSRYFSGNEEVGELTASRIEEALSVLGGKAPEKKGGRQDDSGAVDASPVFFLQQNHSGTSGTGAQ